MIRAPSVTTLSTAPPIAPAALTAASPLALVADDMREVDKVIGQRLLSHVPLVDWVARHIIAAGGKPLRPALLLMVCGALGYGGAHPFSLAAMVAMIHTATLLHDD